MADFQRNQAPDPRLSLIAIAWALAAVMHIFTFAYLAPPCWEGWLLLAALVGILLRPSSLARFGTFLVITAVTLGSNYTVLANHLVFEFWITLSAIAALAFKNGAGGKAFLDLFAPLVRTQYLLLYLFAFWSKLNTDFIYPSSSCAAYFVTEIIETYRLDAIPGIGALGHSAAVGYAATGFTLGLELLIPILLTFRQTRRAGVICALTFHSAMGLVPILGISSFSSLSFAILLFFLPEDDFAPMVQRLHRAGAWLFRSHKRACVLKVILIVTLGGMIMLQYRGFHPNPALATLIWLLLSVPLIGLVLGARHPAFIQAAKPLPPSLRDFFPQPTWLSLLCGPLFLLATLPYLGLQTQGSFTMFSNLRIIGEQTNHLIARPSWQVSEPELIRIIDTNLPSLTSVVKAKALVTSHEIRRAASLSEKDYYILCEDGVEIVLIGRFEGNLTPHRWLEPLPFFPQHFIRFKAVSTNERCECVW